MLRPGHCIQTYPLLMLRPGHCILTLCMYVGIQTFTLLKKPGYGYYTFSHSITMFFWYLRNNKPYNGKSLPRDKEHWNIQRHPKITHIVPPKIPLYDDLTNHGCISSNHEYWIRLYRRPTLGSNLHRPTKHSESPNISYIHNQFFKRHKTGQTTA